jgi:hypothetical protein
MYKRALVDKQIKERSRLLSALDRRHLPVAAAFWYDIPEAPDWRLVIASPIVDKLRPTGAYAQLHKVLRQLHLTTLSVGNISIFSPRESTFRSVWEDEIKPGFALNGPPAGLRREMVRDNAYIYRA